MIHFFQLSSYFYIKHSISDRMKMKCCFFIEIRLKNNLQLNMTGYKPIKATIIIYEQYIAKAFYTRKNGLRFR